MGVGRLIDAAERLLRHGDAEGALRLVWRLEAGAPGPRTLETAQRLWRRLRAALEYPWDEATGLTAVARDELCVGLAAAVLLGMGVPHLVDRLWPTLAQERYAFPALDAYIQRLRAGAAAPLDPWLGRLTAVGPGAQAERLRAELLVHHAYFSVLHRVARAEIERDLLVEPPALVGVRVRALRQSGCPLCRWPDVTYTGRTLTLLPTLPAHPGCRCVYQPISCRE